MPWRARVDPVAARIELHGDGREEHEAEQARERRERQASR